MSNTSKVVFHGVAGVVVAVVVMALGITIATLAVGYLLPLATAGAVAPGFVQSLAIVATGLLARAVVFAGSK